MCGGRVALVAWLVSAALSPGPALAQGTAGLGTELPAVSSGDIVFHVDAASFRGTGGRNRVELALAIPNDEIFFQEREGAFAARVRLALHLADSSGAEVASLDRDYALSAGTLRAAGDRTVLQLLTQAMSVPPGSYRLRVEVEDREKVKTGIWYQLRGEHPRGTAEVELVSPSFDGRAVALSDLQFARLTLRDRASVTGELDVAPNPARLYGLLLPELVASFEVYGPAAGEGEGRPWVTTCRITGPGGSEVFRERNVETPESPVGGAKTVRVDVSQFPAGSYVLRLEITDQGQRVLAARSGSFEVAWSLYCWGRQLSQILAEMQLLLSPGEFARLERMNRGEAEAFLTRFWLDRDPTPGTPANEALQEHFRRVAYANRQFSVGERQGMLTDRGRVYIRYGAPDDAEEGYGDDFLTVPEEAARSMFTPPGAASATDDRYTDRLLDAKTREGLERALDGAGGGGGKRYEVWFYDTRAGTLVDRQRGVRRSPRMRFVFLDQNGYGDFKIVYSSEPSEY